MQSYDAFILHFMAESKKKHLYRLWSNDLGLLLSGDLELDVWLQHLLVITCGGNFVSVTVNHREMRRNIPE